jgi:hypothetical protein
MWVMVRLGRVGRRVVCEKSLRINKGERLRLDVRGEDNGDWVVSYY